ncbi:McrC family protein [Pseudomonas protegens]|uniref:McrC family protein n=1 Tax=Pseudomonas protegens TaxID=380021 RepID=UPI0029372BDB|nr:McrC family protein [Pseudomonas protegens]WOE77526.1 McrC family protein [Pseudomonas protegens]
MRELITIREYGRLTTEAVTNTLDVAHVPVSAFDWLCQASTRFYKNGARLLQVEGRQSLRWDSYVGVIETPCGTRIEILPKHFEQGDCEKQSRALLRKMIQAALNLKPREASATNLELYDAPISEWVIQQFLLELDHLLKRGLRFDYQRVEEEQRFLRGQLNVVAHMRQPLGRQHHFQIRHDVFLPDRPENRVLRWVLERVCKSTQQPSNWRLAHELRSLLVEIPTSAWPLSDLRAWSSERLMAHYRAVKPWCELVLNEQMPLAVSGQWHGMSLLFPMEKLFEQYVAAWLRRSLHPSATLVAPARSEFLCQHDSGRMFRLEPDLLLTQGTQNWVLDTKWKRLDGGDRVAKYGLGQSDFYQLFAYGHKYLKGNGELVLIYPSRPAFREALPVFDFDEGLNLRVLPFDLDLESLIGSELTSLPLRSHKKPTEQNVGTG